jgi:hypothetical protein
VTREGVADATCDTRGRISDNSCDSNSQKKSRKRKIIILIEHFGEMNHEGEKKST